MKNEKLIDLEERINDGRTSTVINKENAKKILDEIANYPIDCRIKNPGDITLEEFLQQMRMLVEPIEDIFIQYQSSEL